MQGGTKFSNSSKVGLMDQTAGNCAEPRKTMSGDSSPTEGPVSCRIPLPSHPMAHSDIDDRETTESDDVTSETSEVPELMASLRDVPACPSVFSPSSTWRPLVVQAPLKREQTPDIYVQFPSFPAAGEGSLELQPEPGPAPLHIDVPDANACAGPPPLVLDPVEKCPAPSPLQSPLDSYPPASDPPCAVDAPAPAPAVPDRRPSGPSHVYTGFSGPSEAGVRRPSDFSTQQSDTFSRMELLPPDGHSVTSIIASYQVTGELPPHTMVCGLVRGTGRDPCPTPVPGCSTLSPVPFRCTNTCHDLSADPPPGVAAEVAIHSPPPSPPILMPAGGAVPKWGHLSRWHHERAPHLSHFLNSPSSPPKSMGGQTQDFLLKGEPNTYAWKYRHSRAALMAPPPPPLITAPLAPCCTTLRRVQQERPRQNKALYGAPGFLNATRSVGERDCCYQTFCGKTLPLCKGGVPRSEFRGGSSKMLCSTWCLARSCWGAHT